MDFVRWETSLNGLHDDGVRNRAYVEESARRGNPEAIAKLQGPEFPEALGYLYDWSNELSRTRTAGVNGPGPLTYQTIRAWADLTGRDPDPLDVDGLLVLDAVQRHPETEPDAEDVAEPVTVVTPAWPMRRAVERT